MAAGPLSGYDDLIATKLQSRGLRANGLFGMVIGVSTIPGKLVVVTNLLRKDTLADCGLALVGFSPNGEAPKWFVHPE